MLQQDETKSGQPPKNRIHGDDVIDDLRVRSGECNHDGPNALEKNGNNGNACLRMDPSYAAKENTVFRHSEINSRRSEHGLAEKSKGGKGNSGGNERTSAWTERRTHDRGGRRRCGCQTCWTERADINKIRGSIHRDHAENPEDQSARKRLSRVT